VVGYAYAGPYRIRPAYDWTVEDSIYVHPDAVGAGLGRALLEAVIEHCTALGYRQMVAVIGDSANGRSMALHRACGFTQVGVLKDVGWKLGRWVDSVLMQRALGPGAGRPV
jgi:L-amino acid N-acyltransferase YncA